MRPVIAFDLDGVLISTNASDKAHAAWFRLMGQILNDSSVEQLSQKKEYFGDVLNLMERLTGLDKTDTFNQQILVKLARNLYQLSYLSELRKEGRAAFVPEMIDMIIDLKSKFRIALITTAPEDMVLPALEIVKIKELFDYIYRSPLNKEPSKIDVLTKFVKDVSSPALYIGNEKKDAEACRQLGIKFALAKWGRYDEDAALISKFTLTSPQQLRGVAELLGAQ